MKNYNYTIIKKYNNRLVTCSGLNPYEIPKLVSTTNCDSFETNTVLLEDVLRGTLLLMT